MEKRNLRVLKWLGPTPAVGVCSLCGRQFTVPIAALKRMTEAQANLRAQFAEHKCREEGTIKSSSERERE